MTKKELLKKREKFSKILTSKSSRRSSLSIYDIYTVLLEGIKYEDNGIFIDVILYLVEFHDCKELFSFKGALSEEALFEISYMGREATMAEIGSILRYVVFLMDKEEQKEA